MVGDKCLQIGAIYDQFHQLVPAALQRLQLSERTEIQDLHFVFAYLQLGQVLRTKRENGDWGRCTGMPAGYGVPEAGCRIPTAGLESTHIVVANQNAAAQLAALQAELLGGCLAKSGGLLLLCRRHLDGQWMRSTVAGTNFQLRFVRIRLLPRGFEHCFGPLGGFFYFTSSSWQRLQLRYASTNTHRVAIAADFICFSGVIIHYTFICKT